MFQRLLKDESAMITYTNKAVYLFIPDVESDTCLRYWANCWDTVITVWKLLTTAIEHSIRFYLALPPDSGKR
ncbi:hypothetical protein K443DRAFT_16106 [Laccaria amethystina LaAM-08-1]|uniref:Uncharacterized protein n=1 Tax=Laccaria amethystina LaAM-08-1 TaxID=1095629 RepID=A0A0C9WPI9_9AGAR|nr:hypothetical protein K443DRAFT_16106 [Laccaria amethystina LaAM-08-1]